MFDASASNTIKLQVKNTFDKDVQLLSSDKQPTQGIQVRIVAFTSTRMFFFSCNFSAKNCIQLKCSTLSFMFLLNLKLFHSL